MHASQLMHSVSSIRNGGRRQASGRLRVATRCSRPRLAVCVLRMA